MSRYPGRVLVVNHWHDDNRGDSAISQGILQLLAHVVPSAQVEVVGLVERGPGWERSTRAIRRSTPSITSRPSALPTEMRGHPGARRNRLLRAIDSFVWLCRLVPAAVALGRGHAPRNLRALVAGADLVVLVGGSNIYDDPSVSRPLSLARLLTVAAPGRAAVLAGIPTVLLGHTLGPFEHRAGLRLAHHLLAGTSLTVVREHSSTELARALGAGHVEVAPDMAFAITPTRSAAVDSILAALPRPAHRCLAISMRQHPSLGPDADRRVVRVLAATATQLAERGLIDSVLLVAHTVGPTPVEDDRGVTRALREAIVDLPTTVLDAELTPNELSAVYGACAAVVAVRLHAAILAIASGTPTFAISYFTQKTKGVMADAGLGEAVGDFADVGPEQIVETIVALATSRTRSRLLAESEQRRADLAARAGSWFDLDRSTNDETVIS